MCISIFFFHLLLFVSTNRIVADENTTTTNVSLNDTITNDTSSNNDVWIIGGGNSSVSSNSSLHKVINVDHCRYVPSLENAYNTFNKRFIHQYGYKNDYDMDQNLIVIGHRGASYHVPEHTLGAYQLALELHVDYIEPDLVITSDGYFIAYHSVDLLDDNSVITEADIITLYPTKLKWHSPYMDRTSYFAFNFTLREIQQLFVHQRLASTSYRTTLYDHLFHIPTLDDIIQLLYDWNRKALPSLLYRSHENINRNMTLDHNDTTFSFTTNNNNGIRTIKPSPIQYLQSGIYIELKESAWMYNDVGVNVVEKLFFTIYDTLEAMNNDTMVFYNSTIGTSDSNAAIFNMTGPIRPWEHLILPCYDEFDTTMDNSDFILPPIVLQSFNGQDFNAFHDLWERYEPRMLVRDPYSGYLQSRRIAEPPYVLLVDATSCHSDKFWHEYQAFDENIVAGIGCEKECLLPTNDTDFPQFLKQAIENDVVVHPWTNRPELNQTNEKIILADRTATVMFANSYEEIRYFQCELGINGIFTENIQLAIMAATLGCGNHTNNMESQFMLPTSSLYNHYRNNSAAVQCPTTSSNQSHHHHYWYLWLIFYFLTIGFAIYGTMKYLQVMQLGNKQTHNNNATNSPFLNRSGSSSGSNKSLNSNKSSVSNRSVTNTNKRKKQAAQVKEEHLKFNDTNNIHDMDHNDAVGMNDEGHWIN